MNAIRHRPAAPCGLGFLALSFDAARATRLEVSLLARSKNVTHRDDDLALGHYMPPRNVFVALECAAT